MSPKKPAVAIRKPPAPVDPRAAERFVTEGAARKRAPPRKTPQASKARKTSPKTAPAQHAKAIIARKDGRELRRMTVYLPPALARRLAIYAAHKDTDVSGSITEICSNFLDRWRA